MNMLDPALPFRMHDRELERNFPQLDDLIVVVIEGQSRQQVQDVADALTKTLLQDSNLFRSIYQPGGGPFFARHGLLYLDTEELWQLDERLTEAAPLIGALSQDPSLHGLFTMLGRSLGEDLTPEHEATLLHVFDSIGKTIEAQLTGQPSQNSWHEQMLDLSQADETSHRSFVLIQPRLDYSNLQAGQDAISTIRHRAQTVEDQTFPAVRIRLTGSVAIADDELGSSLQGAAYATLLSFGLVWILLLLGLWSLRLVVAILLTLFTGLVWTTALGIAMIGHLNVISITFPVLYIGLGVDFGIQFAMRYREEIRQGSGHHDALRQAVQGIGGALTLAAISAGISFISFAFTSYRGLAEMGIIASSGMFVALLCNLTLLPALLTIFPLRHTHQTSSPALLAHIHSRILRHRQAVLWCSAFAAGGALILLPQTRFDFDPLHLKDPTTESVSTFQDLLHNAKHSPYTISIVADSLEQAHMLTTQLKQLDVVDKTITLADYVPTHQADKLPIIEDLNLVLQPLTMPTSPLPPPQIAEQVQAWNTFVTKLNQAQHDHEALLHSQKHVADKLQYLQTLPGWPEAVVHDLEKRLLQGLSKTLDRLGTLLSTTGITIEDLPHDIRERYLAQDGRARIQVFPKDNLSHNNALRQFVEAVQTVAPHATDTPVAILEGGDAIVKACLEATTFTLIASLLILLTVLRNLRDTLLVLLPLGLATILTLAGSILLHIPLNLANIIALPLLLGLGLAFGIYLILRTREGLSLEKLFQSSTPHAVLLSALTTITSFGTLAFSTHQGIASIGMLLTLSLSLAILCTLIVLPAALAKIHGPKDRIKREDEE